MLTIEIDNVINEQLNQLTNFISIFPGKKRIPKYRH